MTSIHESPLGTGYDLAQPRAECEELVGLADFARLSAELAETTGQLAEESCQLQILSYYKGPRFPRPGLEIVRIALLSGFSDPVPDQTRGIVELRTSEIDDRTIDYLQQEGIPILPVAFRLEDSVWRIYRPEPTRGRMHVYSEIMKALKFDW